MPSDYIEDIAKDVADREKEKANLHNYSSATSSALLNCIISGLGGGKSKFDPSIFLPNPPKPATEEDSEDEEELEIDDETAKLIFTELQNKNLPPWVIPLFRDDINRWREKFT